MTNKFSSTLLVLMFSVSTVTVSFALSVGTLLFPQFVIAQQISRGSGSISMELPDTGNQDDQWSCGANSAARVLAFYGHNIDYWKVRSVAQRDHGIIPQRICVFGKCKDLGGFKTGLEPHEVREIMKRWEGENVRLERKASFDKLKSLLSEGKPVVALLRVGSFKPGGIFGTWPEMHWVAVHGFDESQSLIYYTDTNTNGKSEPISYNEFLSKWNWNIGDGLASETFYQKGVQPRTMVWVDRAAQGTVRYEEALQQQGVDLYRNILGRDPEPGAAEGVASRLANGSTLARERQVMANSEESRNNAVNLYRNILGRDPEPGAAEGIVSRLASDSTLARERQVMANSEESRNNLANLYRTILGREPEAGAVDGLVSRLANGSTLAQEREIMANSEEARRRRGL